MVATLDKRVNLGPGWQEVLVEELKQPYMGELAAFVAGERRAGKHIYPPAGHVFNAFLQTPFDQVKVVIVGQDPYHGPGQAHGLCFSVMPGVKIPPSLRNIYQELQNDLGIPPAHTGCLLPWAHQGVLLLNATLTVEEGKPRSHYGRGWERFTDAAIRTLVDRDVIFVLWGSSARQKVENVTRSAKTLQAPHPSPLSAHRGFFGCRHFSQVNQMLKEMGKEPIDWRIKK